MTAWRDTLRQSNRSAADAKPLRMTAHAQLVRMPTVLTVESPYDELTPRETQRPVFAGSCISSVIGTDSLAGQSGNCACTALPLSSIDRLRYAQHCGQGVSVLLRQHCAASAPPAHLVILRHGRTGGAAIVWRERDEYPTPEHSSASERRLK